MSKLFIVAFRLCLLLGTVLVGVDCAIWENVMGQMQDGPWHCLLHIVDRDFCTVDEIPVDVLVATDENNACSKAISQSGKDPSRFIVSCVGCTIGMRQANVSGEGGAGVCSTGGMGGASVASGGSQPSAGGTTGIGASSPTSVVAVGVGGSPATTTTTTADVGVGAGNAWSDDAGTP